MGNRRPATSTDKQGLNRRRGLFRLIIARSDLRAAHEVASYARQHVKEMTDGLWIPLQDAVVIAYARPFTSNKPHGALANQWSKFDDTRRQQLHREILDMRNRLVAHGDASQRSVMVYPPAARPPIPVARSNRAASAVTQERPSPSWFERVDDLCLDLGGRLNEAAEDELQTLFGGDDAPTEPFDLMTGDPVEWPKGDGTLIETPTPW